MFYSNTTICERHVWLRWTFNRGGISDDCSFNEFLRGSNAVQFPGKGIWCNRGQKKVAFFWGVCVCVQ